MPPKAKFTRDEIIAAALSVIRKDGFDALKARSLGTELGSSARPIFTVFKSMEEVQVEAVEAARTLYDSYIQNGLSQDSMRFKGIGRQYIFFAISEPRLFQLLFMREQRSMTDIAGMLPEIDANYSNILASIESEYGLERAEARRVYQHLWIYTYGIASLCVTKTCRFTEDEISCMMTEVCMSILKNIKNGRQK